MGEEQKLSGPDLSEGVAAPELGDGKMLLGHARGEAVLLVRKGEGICRWSHLHALLGSARRGRAGRRNVALSVASCLFRSAHRRGGARARIESDPALRGHGRANGPGGRASPAEDASRPLRCASGIVILKRRRRSRGGRDAAP